MKRKKRRPLPRKYRRLSTIIRDLKLDMRRNWVVELLDQLNAIVTGYGDSVPPEVLTLLKRYAFAVSQCERFEALESEQQSPDLAKAYEHRVARLVRLIEQVRQPEHVAEQQDLASAFRAAMSRSVMDCKPRERSSPPAPPVALLPAPDDPPPAPSAPPPPKPPALIEGELIPRANRSGIRGRARQDDSTIIDTSDDPSPPGPSPWAFD
ncbi:MAG: hypothetical protein ACREMY_10330 [bacterium]